MAKGNTAKTNVINKIAEAFGTSYIGEYDKKVYVWADDGGEKVQIAISLTCPKVQIACDNPDGDEDNSKSFDWDNEPEIKEVAPKEVKISDEERATIAKLMAEVGL